MTFETDAEQSNGELCREDRGRERQPGARIFLLDRLQAFDKKKKIPSGRFGPAEAGAVTRWKWRRKLLERLNSAMEMALSEAGRLE
jgi:hypothetical protein